MTNRQTGSELVKTGVKGMSSTTWLAGNLGLFELTWEGGVVGSTPGSSVGENINY